MHLELANVTKRYGDFAAVSDISFGVERGERLSLLGPSGCGKTTLLNAIAGFVDLSAGQIKVDGRNVTDVPPYKRDVGIVFQNYALFPHLNVEENVFFGLRMRGTSRADARTQIDRALQIVRLEAFRERMPNQLSGGQQQRVAIARAIVFKPKILLLDEPLSNLDAKLREGMRADLLAILDELSVTAILVTHDQSEALSLSHRVAVMSNGHVEQIGTPEQIYENPQTHFAASFIGESNRIDVTLETVNGKNARLRMGPDRFIVTSRAPELRSGAQATVFVRSERISVSATPLLLDNSLQGTLKQAIYLGGERRLIIESEGRQFQALEQTRGDSGGIGRPGDTIHFGWEASDSIVLPGDGKS